MDPEDTGAGARRGPGRARRPLLHQPWSGDDEDFAWWAGITAQDAQRAVDGAGPRLAREVVGGRAYYWSARNRKRMHGQAAPRVKLLPAYDEYMVAYADRSLLTADGKADAMGLLAPAVVADGLVIGRWKRGLGKDGAQVAAKLLRPLTLSENEALVESASALGRFLGQPFNLVVSAPRATRRSRLRLKS